MRPQHQGPGTIRGSKPSVRVQFDGGKLAFTAKKSSTYPHPPPFQHPVSAQVQQLHAAWGERSVDHGRLTCNNPLLSAIILLSANRRLFAAMHRPRVQECEFEGCPVFWPCSGSLTRNGYVTTLSAAIQHPVSAQVQQLHAARGERSVDHGRLTCNNPLLSAIILLSANQQLFAAMHRPWVQECEFEGCPVFWPCSGSLTKNGYVTTLSAAIQHPVSAQVQQLHAAWGERSVDHGRLTCNNPLLSAIILLSANRRLFAAMHRPWVQECEFEGCPVFWPCSGSLTRNGYVTTLSAAIQHPVSAQVQQLHAAWGERSVDHGRLT